MSEFADFWALYPRKIGKLAAMKAYNKARLQATAEQLMAGLSLYREHLPEDMQFVPHAATWLNQGRWLDEYEDAVTVSKLKAVLRPMDRARLDTSWDGAECPHETTCSTRGVCQMMQSVARKRA